MNVCSEETVVEEFGVRYPVMCEWLQWSLRVLRKNSDTEPIHINTLEEITWKLVIW